jgi:hypothetical protein
MTMGSDGSIKRREDTSIRRLFTNTGIPGYFTLAQEITPSLLDQPVPELDYMFEIQTEPASRIDIQTRKVYLPSIDQVLWAIGFMSVELENAIGSGAIRFMHKPFRAHLCPFHGSEPWRQVVVRRIDCGYKIETICVADRLHKSIYGYLSVRSQRLSF